MTKHTMQELVQMQSLPLDLKIDMTCNRIKAWIKEYGEDGVYISFSGGKDSTVLLDIVRNVCGYKNIPAMFVDVPTQYPELKEFVKTFDNVDIIRPKISFAEVYEKYGFPIISKEVSECVYGARKYARALAAELGAERERERERERVSESLTDIFTENSQELANMLNDKLVHRSGGSNLRLAKMLGWFTKDRDHPIKANIPSKDRSNFSQEKYKFFLDAPFEISNQCCNVMKKTPAHRYAKETGRKPMTAQMADESRIRMQKWLQNGCNAFNANNPISNPMSFWKESDILQYIYENDIPICSVYGDVIKEGCNYKTTGCSRTGCVCCAFGAQCEKEPNRFQQLHETHPGMYGLLDKIKNNGVTYREAIEWINEHSDLDIKL